MKCCSVLWAAAWLAFMASLAAAADEQSDVSPAMSPIVVPGTQQFDLTAKSGRVYRISVAAPAGAAPATGWPVIYLTDGNANFLPLLVTAQKQSREGVPAVLVGIGYPESDRAVISARRSWDLTPATDPAWIEKFGRGTVAEKTGGRDEFLAFVVDELKPVIERKYAINRQQQTLFGHSFGGLFALHVLFNRPVAFQTYLVTSASLWWNDRSTLPEAEAFLKSAAGQPVAARVLFMVGELEETSRGVPPERAKVLAERQMVTASKTLSERFSAAGVVGLSAEFRVFPEEDHGSVMLLALHQGVRFALATVKKPSPQEANGQEAKAKEPSGKEGDRQPQSAPPEMGRALPQFAGDLIAESHGRHPLVLQAGDYVRGHLEGVQMQLALVDAQGAVQRVLATGRGERQEFQFVAGAAGEQLLQVNSVPGGRYTLHVAAIVPQTAQAKPARVLESPRLRTLAEQLRAGGTTERFWQEVREGRGPLVEAEGVMPPLANGTRLVTFLWRGASQGVRLFGAPSNDHDDLQRLGNSDVWFGSYRVPATARIDYKLAPDVPELNDTAMIRRRAILATAQRDPLNPVSFPAGPLSDPYAGVSVVELPDAPAPEWLEQRADVPAGVVEAHRLPSQLLNNTRDMAIYRPHGYRPDAEGNGLVIIFDGDRYQDDIPTPTILDNLLAAQKIPPTAAIFISNPTGESRAAELPCNPLFAQFLVEEVLPWAQAQGVVAAPEKTVVAGASYGGLAAAYAGFQYPERFGTVICQSGSFWWSPGSSPAATVGEAEWLTRQFAAAERKPVKFVLEAGLFEVGRREVGILDATRHLRDVLIARGNSVQYSEFAGGHGYFFWRYTFPKVLISALGTTTPHE